MLPRFANFLFKKIYYTVLCCLNILVATTVNGVRVNWAYDFVNDTHR